MCIRVFIEAFLVVMLLRTVALHAASVDDGRTLFQSRCARCHMIDQRLVGPALKDIYKSQSEEWIISFVHSPAKKIHSGDTAAANLYQRFQPTIMPDQADLSNDQIKGLIAYIKAESDRITTSVPPSLTPAISGDTTITWSNYWFWCGVAALLVILVYGFIILTRAYKAKEDYLLSKNKE